MKVAIIGAGFSGLLAGYLLQKAHIDVTIYEKRGVVGGHCQTLHTAAAPVELGTAVSFNKCIKPLLRDLEINSTECFVYRDFIDASFNSIEHISRADIPLLLEELGRLNELITSYTVNLHTIQYGRIPEDLLIPFSAFLSHHGFKTIAEVIGPFLSAFGLGSVDTLQAYYALNIFDSETLYRFMQGEKALVLPDGFSTLTDKLATFIPDIRYNLEVTSIELSGNLVTVSTDYSTDTFDHVLLTAKLPDKVLKNTALQHFMQKIQTTPFISCTYEVYDKDLVTTYFKHYSGKPNKIQFFHIAKPSKETLLVAYAYGIPTPELIATMTADIASCGIQIKRMVTLKEWSIFPHVSTHDLTSSFYEDLATSQNNIPITCIGSLISKPSIDALYLSVLASTRTLIDRMTPSNPLTKKQ